MPTCACRNLWKPTSQRLLIGMLLVRSWTRPLDVQVKHRRGIVMCLTLPGDFCAALTLSLTALWHTRLTQLQYMLTCHCNSRLCMKPYSGSASDAHHLQMYCGVATDTRMTALCMCSSSSAPEHSSSDMSIFTSAEMPAVLPGPQAPKHTFR